MRVLSISSLLCGLLLAACGSPTSSGSGDITVIHGTMTDGRDGQIYRTVTIGAQTWMAQNLNYRVDSSWCYDNADSCCVKYGRLYQWAGMMALDTVYNSQLWLGEDSARHQGVCPAGWHVPADGDWAVLIEAVGGEDSAGIQLKSATEDWYGGDGQPGRDPYGFSVLPAGARYSDGTFGPLGYYALLWSASEADESVAWYRNFSYNHADVRDLSFVKRHARSVRCLKD